ncbi:hypothetical protein [Micromonospora tarensis]|uniref:Uncharacterized protein n=1 Tax=Micromonospora tarensis TaxID=2806100 RepID=A0ABS1YK45_9ACTN|nr:hypothetical protein [Micromonospora tarensis]MBM0277803.1 hypothetical protein [Micromonospora tarensis]
MSDDPQPLYTLEQAQQILKRRQCEATQHLLVPVDGSACVLRCGACENTFDLVLREAS